MKFLFHIDGSSSGLLVNVEKPRVFSRLLQAAVGIGSRKKTAEGAPIRLRISHWLRHFPQAGVFFFFFGSFFFLTSFPCGKPAGSRYELPPLSA
jgi:hypothetical protein